MPASWAKIYDLFLKDNYLLTFYSSHLGLFWAFLATNTSHFKRYFHTTPTLETTGFVQPSVQIVVRKVRSHNLTLFVRHEIAPKLKQLWDNSYNYSFFYLSSFQCLNPCPSNNAITKIYNVSILFDK